VDLGGGLDEILQMGAREEVAEVHELAVVLVLDVHDTPAVFAAPDGLAVDDDVGLRADDCEGDFCSDRLVGGNLLLFILVCVEGVQPYVVVHELFPNLLLEPSFSSTVRLSDFAMTGTTLTTSLSFFMTITSMGRREWPVGLRKYKQQWMRVSWM